MEVDGKIREISRENEAQHRNNKSWHINIATEGQLQLHQKLSPKFVHLKISVHRGLFFLDSLL